MKRVLIERDGRAHTVDMAPNQVDEYDRTAWIPVSNEQGTHGTVQIFYRKPTPVTAEQVAEAAVAWAKLNPGRFIEDRTDVLYDLVRRYEKGLP